jgi:general secretion pathway protein K
MNHQRLAKQLMAQMARPDLNPLFEQRDSTGNFHDRMAVCSAIIDWADFDEQAYSCDVNSAAPTSSAIEDAYYQLMEKPYRRKNSPYDSLEELHMVRGMSDSLWATIVDPDPTNPKKRNMTVWGQGKINVNSANAQTLLAVVCSYAQAGTELCTDPLQMASFVSAVTMAQGMAMGAPVFGSTREFIATVQGKGMLGPLLTGMGMKPVKFTSDKLLTDSITTESKVFSIYAVGVVKGYKRETRTSIHAVVDFSTAPRLNQALPGAAASGSGSIPGTPPPVPSASGSARQDPNAIAAAMAPATGGQILYYKIE